MPLACVNNSFFVNDSFTADIKVYKCSSKGILLPLINEYTWPIGVRAGLYFVGLLYSFLGVSVVADVFMCSIEKITSHTRTFLIKNPETEEGFEKLEVKIWNDTVANLTLMALGTSAPEILLSIIETVGSGFVVGELGAATIVGSAAVNLHLITAVCVIVVNSPDTRRIKGIRVFIVTTVFSIFAYIWLVIVLVIITPEQVDLWEAVLTFLFFPILVLTAYSADKNFFRQSANKQKNSQNFPINETKQTISHLTEGLQMNANTFGLSPEHAAYYMNDGKISWKQMREFLKYLRKSYPKLTDEEIARMAAVKVTEEQAHDRLWYRINATRQLFGGWQLEPTLNNDLRQVYDDALRAQRQITNLIDRRNEESGTIHDMTNGGKIAVVEFEASRSSVHEQERQIRVGIRRYGNLNNCIQVRVETINGTAESGKDYVALAQTISFIQTETTKTVEIDLIEDYVNEPDKVFFVKLSLDMFSCDAIALGHKIVHEITIIDDDKLGTFEFIKPSVVIAESAGQVEVEVQRTGRSDGRVEVSWETVDMTALAGRDYISGVGILVFEHGETLKTIDITIIDNNEFEKNDYFRVDLLELSSSGAKLGRHKQTIVNIVNDDAFKTLINRLVTMTNANLAALRVDQITWSEQFRNAMTVNDGDIENAKGLDYFMHFLSFGLKVAVAFVPPPSMCGGYLSFICALGVITLLTTIIGDLATIFGCLSGLTDTVTAITILGLGTNIPDLFACKYAATAEKTADNAIGNVTASNAVNVFIGIGLSWILSSIYWESKGSVHRVPAGSLSSSVIIFLITALITIGTLAVRRKINFFGKGELGGPKCPKIATSLLFVGLWLTYVIISITYNS